MEVGEEEFGDFNNEEEDEVGFINNLIDYLVFEGLSKASRPWTYWIQYMEVLDSVFVDHFFGFLCIDIFLVLPSCLIF